MSDRVYQADRDMVRNDGGIKMLIRGGNPSTEQDSAAARGLCGCDIAHPVADQP